MFTYSDHRYSSIYALTPISKVQSENAIVNVFYAFTFQYADSILNVPIIIINYDNIHHSCLCGSHLWTKDNYRYFAIPQLEVIPKTSH